MVNKIKILSATIVGNKPQTGNICQLILDPGNNFDVTEILPGQFVCFEPLDPGSVMARPFSVAVYDVKKNTFSVLYKVVGKNTQAMTQLKAGDNVNFWGPLGQGFDANFCNYDEVWLVGGGIGIAPLFFFEKVISKDQKGLVRFFYGNKNKEEIIDLDLYASEQVAISTDDGSAGFHGFVSDLFLQELQQKKDKDILVITCGPNAMMQKVIEICQQYKLDCYVILERIMACGINSCKGCSIKTRSGMKRVCHDGPVFPAEEVIWDELS